MWEKRGDAIADAEDLVRAIKTLCGLPGVYWHYPVRTRSPEDPLITVSAVAHSSPFQWGGRETASTETFSCDIFTAKQEKLEHFVKLVSDNMLSNNVRVVGRMDGRGRIGMEFSAHLTLQASRDVYGRTYRGM